MANLGLRSNLLVSGRMVQKIHNVKSNNDESRKFALMLSNVQYFIDMFAETPDRLDFLQIAAPYAVHKFYQKGSIVVHKGDASLDFGVIVQGKGYMYQHKDTEAIIQELESSKNKTVILQYWDAISHAAKSLKLSNDNQSNAKSMREKKISMKNADYSKSEYFELLAEKEKGGIENDYEALVSYILNPPKPILNQLQLEEVGDLEENEKLLLLAAYHSGRTKYLESGVLTFKSVGVIETGGSICENSLLINTPSEYTIVASEDLHVFYFTREDYKFIFSKRINNILTRKEFLIKIFPEMSTELLLKVAYFLKEKNYTNYQQIYNQGDKADQIFFVREGEAQLLTYKKVDTREKLPGSQLIKQDKKHAFSSKQKILVANIQQFGIFGEEEVVQKKPRKFLAMSGSVLTKLYYIKARGFFQIFTKLLTPVAEAIKRPIAEKARWHEQRKHKEQKITREYTNYGYEDSDANSNNESSSFLEEEIAGAEQYNQIIQFEAKKNPSLAVDVRNSGLMDRMLLVHNTEMKPAKENKIVMSKLYQAERERHRPKSTKALRRKLANSKTLAKFKLTNYDFITPLDKMTKLLALQRMERIEKDAREERVRSQAKVPTIEIEGISMMDFRPMSGKSATNNASSPVFKIATRPQTTQGLFSQRLESKENIGSNIFSTGDDKMVSRGFFSSSQVKKARPQTAAAAATSAAANKVNISTKIISDSPRPLSSSSTHLFKRITATMKPKEGEFFSDYGMVSPRTLKIKTLTNATDSSQLSSTKMTRPQTSRESTTRSREITPAIVKGSARRQSLKKETESSSTVKKFDVTYKSQPTSPRVPYINPEFFSPRTNTDLYDNDHLITGWSQDLSDMIMTGEKKSILVQSPRDVVEGYKSKQKLKNMTVRFENC